MCERGKRYAIMYTYASPLGEITLASDGSALTGLWFVGQKHYAGIPGNDCAEKASFVFGQNDDCTGESHAILQSDGGEEKALQIFRETASWLDIYFSGKEPDFMPEIALSGTPFQMAVWKILKTVPYGQTITYGEIALQIAEQRGIRRMSAQAVGGAVGRNPISILVPCHRVVGKSGNLTGYAGGIERKTSLLKLEGVDMASLFRPRTT